MGTEKKPKRSKDAQLAHDLWDAIEADDQEKIHRLIKAGANPNYANNMGWTNLQKACLDGNVKHVRRLIELGANVNLADISGWSPLHEACFCGNLEIVKILIEAGADPHQVKGEDFGDGEVDKRKPLDIAINEGHEPIVAYLRSLDIIVV